MQLEPPAAAAVRRRLTHTAGSLAAHVTGSAVSTAAGVASRLPLPLGDVVRSARQMVQEVPHLDAEVDAVVDQLQAQRLSIQALSVELAALDKQLEVLQTSLAPVQAWAHRWADSREGLVHALERMDALAAGHPEGPEPDEV